MGDEKTGKRPLRTWARVAFLMSGILLVLASPVLLVVSWFGSMIVGATGVGRGGEGALLNFGGIAAFVIGILLLVRGFKS
jgi:hypothetical protein